MTDSQQRHHPRGIPGRHTPEEAPPARADANGGNGLSETTAYAVPEDARKIDVVDLLNASDAQRRTIEACWRALSESVNVEGKEYLMRCLADVFRPRPIGPASEPID